MKMQVVPFKIRFKPCLIALDNGIDCDVNSNASNRTIDVGRGEAFKSKTKIAHFVTLINTSDLNFYCASFCDRS